MKYIFDEDSANDVYLESSVETFEEPAPLTDSQILDGNIF
jgi:hypothetical protein